MGVRPRVWRTTRLGIATFVRRKEGVVDTGDRLLTPGEVAALFRVDPKTVTRWAAAGRISSIRTPGGHRRFRESEVRALLEGEEGMADESSAQTRSPQPS
jgi:excisionase family DNA binding protein